MYASTTDGAEPPTIPSGQCQCGCGAPTKLAPRTRRSLGWVKGKPLRYVRGHGRRKRVRHVEEDRGHGSPCWITKLATNSCGYGPHRRSYEEHCGPIPSGKCLDHVCGQRDC